MYEETQLATATPAYPKVPGKAWRVLRSRAASAPSTKFTPATVAALLDMANPKSAADSIVYPLRRLGLIDDEGALTDRGNKWRIDSTYGNACEEVLNEVYPSDLGALTGEDGTPDKARVTTWFQHKGFGRSNATQMASTYVMIAQKDLPDASTGDRNAPSKRPTKKASPAKKTAVAHTDAAPRALHVPENAVGRDSSGPNVHLDIQIHIPADASVEQIDQIFASMAKHLYQK